MIRDAEVQRLEAERLRPVPPPVPRPDPLTATFRALLDVIAGECRRAGYLP